MFNRLYKKWRDVRYYILHRWVWVSHRYPIRDYEKGQYYDIDDKMFLAVFSMLVDYVEGEVAHLSKICAADNSHPEVLAYTRATWTDRLINRERWNRRLGLAHLDWEMTLGENSPRQASAAQEVQDLYLWYKDIRPNRPDPHTVFPDTNDWEKYFELTEKYRDEDDEMLCRVIRARHSMWT